MYDSYDSEQHLNFSIDNVCQMYAMFILILILSNLNIIAYRD